MHFKKDLRQIMKFRGERSKKELKLRIYDYFKKFKLKGHLSTLLRWINKNCKDRKFLKIYH